MLSVQTINISSARPSVKGLAPDRASKGYSWSTAIAPWTLLRPSACKRHFSALTNIFYLCFVRWVFLVCVCYFLFVVTDTTLNSWWTDATMKVIYARNQRWLNGHAWESWMDTLLFLEFHAYLVCLCTTARLDPVYFWQQWRIRHCSPVIRGPRKCHAALCKISQ